MYTPVLKMSLSRIRENLIVIENNLDESTERRNKVEQPVMSSTVDLKSSDKLYGLTERVVAVESLLFLGQQYEKLKPYLEQLIPNSPQRGFLHQFYVQTISSAKDLRKPIYMSVVSQELDVGDIINLMNKVNWEVRDVMSQHSSYVDALIRVSFYLDNNNSFQN